MMEKIYKETSAKIIGVTIFISKKQTLREVAILEINKDISKC